MFVSMYRRRPTALGAAGAGAGATFAGSLALVALVFDHPLVLAATLVALAAAAVGAQVGAELRRASRFAVWLAVLFGVVNALVTREGSTLLVRGGEVLGYRLDITLEATVYGLTAGLRVLDVVLAFALFSATVDPDEVLRIFRRISYRSALTASLATRLVPLLARDATRMSDAARCRPAPLGRATLARAALAGALDRAVDVAAALEVRGYATARRPRRAARPRSRHDRRVAAAAATIVAVAVGGRLAGVGGFEPYPELALALGPAEAALAAAVPLLATLPFAGGGARVGVAARG